MVRRREKGLPKALAKQLRYLSIALDMLGTKARESIERNEKAWTPHGSTLRGECIGHDRNHNNALDAG